MTPRSDQLASAATVVYRACAADDLDGVLNAFAQSWSADSLTASWLSDYVFLDDNFDRDGFAVAVVDDTIVGAAYAVAPVVSRPGVDPEGGWIPLLFVRPDYRRAGIGSRLLALSHDFLAARGCQWSNVAAYPPGYLIPGVDVTHGVEGQPFLDVADYSTIESPVSMGIDLTTWSRSEQSLEQQAAAEADGYVFSECHVGDLPDLIEFATKVTEGDWGIVLRNSVIQHGDPERISLVRSPSGQIVGFATFASYGGNIERFGPFGVDSQQRGRALGKILLQHSLGRMRDRGAQRAWFLWTDEHGPAGRLYSQAGFRVIRQFAVMQRPL